MSIGVAISSTLVTTMWSNVLVVCLPSGQYCSHLQSRFPENQVQEMAKIIFKTWSVTILLPLCQFGEHHNAVHSLLHHHLKKVRQGMRQWSLSGQDFGRFASIAGDPGCVDVLAAINWIHQFHPVVVVAKDISVPEKKHIVTE